MQEWRVALPIPLQILAPKNGNIWQEKQKKYDQDLATFLFICSYQIPGLCYPSRVLFCTGDSTIITIYVGRYLCFKWGREL